MEPFWSRLARGFWIGAPVDRLRAVLGVPLCEDLEAAGLLRREPLQDGDPFPCDERAGTGCSRQVVGDPSTGAVAVCGLDSRQCADERIPPESGYRLVLDEDRVIEAIAEALDLGSPPRPPHERGAPIPLGWREFGRARVRFLLVRRAGTELTPFRLQVLAPTEASPVVLVAAHGSAIPSSTRSLCQVPNLEWVFLGEDATLAGGRLTVDLGPWLQRAGLPAVDWGRELFPRRWLVIDLGSGRCFWSGRELRLAGSDKQRELLLALAERPGTALSRRTLQARVWAEDFTPRGHATEDVEVLDTRLRQTRLALERAFEDVGAGPPLPRQPVRHRSPHDPSAGSTWLDVPAERVLIVPPDATPAKT